MPPCRFLCVFLLLLFLPQGSFGNEKTVIGRVERIVLPKHGISLEARVDSGAHTCSLHVVGPKITHIGGERYVEFDTFDLKGKRYHIKTKVHQEASIKSTDGDASARYVIQEEIKLGKITKIVNINLNDRTDLKYEFLLGRNFLRGDFIVDVSRSHVLGD